MNAKDKLKYLMGAKARRLWLLGVKNWHLYYGPEDAEEIDRWDEIKADEIWSEIRRYIFECRVSGLTSRTCPWCNYDLGCGKCGYAKRHFCCADHGSDYSRITWNLRRKWPYIDKFWRRVCFPNEWYREVIEKIEQTN